METSKKNTDIMYSYKNSMEGFFFFQCLDLQNIELPLLFEIHDRIGSMHVGAVRKIILFVMLCLNWKIIFFCIGTRTPNINRYSMLQVSWRLSNLMYTNKSHGKQK